MTQRALSTFTANVILVRSVERTKKGEQTGCINVVHLHQCSTDKLPFHLFPFLLPAERAANFWRGARGAKREGEH